MLLSLASSLNSVPLPPVSNRHGIRLPPPEHCLMNVKFSIVPNPPETQFGDSIMPPPEASAAGGAAPSSAARGDASADTTMEEASHKDGAQGTKRALEEDEEYD